LTEILVENGAQVVAGDLLARLDTDAKAPTSETAQPAAADAAPPAKQTAPDSGNDAATDTSAGTPPVVDPSLLEKLAPAVRRLVSEHQLDPAQIPASGRGGRLTKADVLAFVKQQASQPPPAQAPALGDGQFAPPVVNPERGERRERMSRIRAHIAERLVEAQHTAAILTTFNEVDMQPIMELRAKYKDKFADKYGVRLGMMSFFVRAATVALQEWPMVNASIDGDHIVYHDYYDIGVAVGTERGLVVPVLRDADLLSFAEIESGIVDFAKRAQKGQLGIDELMGGTFSITNGGVYGSLLSTPIINPPQSGILGMHGIQERPIAMNGEVVIRPMMYVALSYDHRLVDGKEAVSFLVTMKQRLEDPARLMLDI
jgi:2-oxoglutarate dehydrogenase E2 component (dihydrolipoamide succinyltransferase)